MSIVLKILAVAVGIFLIYTVMKAMKNKKMSAGQSLLWLFAGLVIIILGIFPSIVHWAADLLGIVWQPAVILFAAVVVIVFIVFNHAKEISVMRAQITELSEQVSVLKYELQKQEILKKETREE